MRALKRKWLLTALIAAGLAALPATALADTTIGMTGGNGFCAHFGPSGQGGVWADTSYVVPSGGGTITSFSFLSDSTNTGQQLDFLVLRPVSSGNYTVVGKSGLVTLGGTGLETFPAQIPVQSGDILGFWTPNGQNVNNCGVSGNDEVITSGSVDDSTGGAIPLAPFFQGDLNEAATLVTSAATDLASLSKTVQGVGTGGSLANKVNQAQSQLASGDTAGACSTLSAFINQVKAQSGKGISPAEATQLISDAKEIEAKLGCRG
ncbi:MAG TPA: hypothetical protein VF137_07550 [Candidatus Dormibacteraeota bacterium]